MLLSRKNEKRSLKHIEGSICFLSASVRKKFGSVISNSVFCVGDFSLNGLISKVFVGGFVG
jgi:hypothetical protein